MKVHKNLFLAGALVFLFTFFFGCAGAGVSAEPSISDDAATEVNGEGEENIAEPSPFGGGLTMEGEEHPLLLASREETGRVPLEYIVYGTKPRVDRVADYMTKRGHRVSGIFHRDEKATMGRRGGKPWPGVQIRQEGAPADEGIWVPVSDKAVREGLCKDQTELIDSLPVFPANPSRAFVVPSVPVASSPPPVACTTSASCDERPFTGVVPEEVLEWAPGGADAIEVHYRKGKPEPFKAKRVKVGTDVVARPLSWPDGSCMRIYSSSQPTDGQLCTLLLPGEKIVQLRTRGQGGNHNTIAIYGITR